jgi:phospholipid transport system substrate-binding protein
LIRLFQYWLVLFVGIFGLQALAWGHPAEEVVKETAEKILTQLRKERAEVQKNPQRVDELVDKIVLPHFDFYKMSSRVLGKYWRRASDEQKEKFTKEFRILLVRTYAKALVDNMDQTIDYLPVRAPKNAEDVTVKTEIPQQGGFPLPIDYSMYLTNGEWKVYDVEIDGVSLVINYRTTFANEIKQAGLDKLIAKLATRNKQAASE